MRYLAVANLERYQHYKDRRPPWIKLHAELLDDYSFACLHDASKAHALLISLLASQCDNRLPYDAAWIGKKICATEPVDLAALVDAGYLLVLADDASCEHAASSALAGREQDAKAEAEAEAETETEATAASRRARAAAGRVPEIERPDAQGYAIAITVAANQGIARRWGEQPNALRFTHPAAREMAEQLIEADIPVTFAESAIVAICGESRQKRPPSTVKYFLAAVRDRWDSELARRAAAALPQVIPLRTANSDGRGAARPATIAQRVFNSTIGAVTAAAREMEEHHD